MKDYEMPVIFFSDEPSADRLGNPKLDTQHYSWEKIKLPQGKTWKKDAKCFKAKDYDASTIYFFDNAPQIYMCDLFLEEEGGMNTFIQKNLSVQF